MAVLQITKFPASQTYLEDPLRSLRGVCIELATVKGVVSFYHGKDVSDSAQAYTIIFWESNKVLRDWRKTTHYKNVRLMMEVAIDPSQILSAEIVPLEIPVDNNFLPQVPLFTAPLTEITIFNVKDIGAFEELQQLCEKIYLRDESHTRESYVIGKLGGPQVGYVVGRGWQEIEDYEKWRNSDIWAQIGSLADVRTILAALFSVS